jgi:hypothetical protein
VSWAITRIGSQPGANWKLGVETNHQKPKKRHSQPANSTFCLLAVLAVGPRTLSVLGGTVHQSYISLHLICFDLKKKQNQNCPFHKIHCKRQSRWGGEGGGISPSSSTRKTH